MSSPKISVVMPNYNCEKYIWEAIESILNQTFTDFEFIIIDDGSTDNSWKIIQEYAQKDKRIVAMKNEENLRICRTLNRGVQLAKWKYIARMDSDDISLSDRLQKQLTFLENNPKICIVGGTMEIMDETWEVYSNRKYNLTDKNIRRFLFRYSPFCHATTMYHKDIAIKVGLYNIFLHDVEDYDFYFRMWLFWQLANLKDVLYKMRVNKNWVTHSSTSRMEKLVLFVRKKAVHEYWYKMSILDQVYYTAQLLSMFIIPWSVKIWLFNLIRNR